MKVKQSFWHDLTVLQWIGVIGIVASLLIWLVADRTVPGTLVAAFGTMYATEEGRKAIKELGGK